MKPKSMHDLAESAARRAGLRNSQDTAVQADYMAYGFIKGYAAAMRRVKRRGRK